MVFLLRMGLRQDASGSSRRLTDSHDRFLHPSSPSLMTSSNVCPSRATVGEPPTVPSERKLFKEDACSPVTMEQQVIYFGELIRRATARDEQARRFVLYHGFPGGSANIIHGASLDHLAGYLDGALFNRWGELRAYSGVPESVAGLCFKGQRVRPLDKTAVQRIYQLADLDERVIAIENLDNA